MAPTIIALAGKLASGKDAVYERMCALGQGLFWRVSFAAKLKESACALLGMDLDTMERLKRMEDFDFLSIWDPESSEFRQDCSPTSEQTMRTFLQRYGTESHRGVFGDDFWVKQAMVSAEAAHEAGFLPVFTDCRFENEAQAVLNAGGEVWRIIGADEDTGDHPSEVPLPDHLISHVIDNTVRDDDFASLDAEVREALRLAEVLA